MFRATRLSLNISMNDARLSKEVAIIVSASACFGIIPSVSYCFFRFLIIPIAVSNLWVSAGLDLEMNLSNCEMQPFSIGSIIWSNAF